MRSCIAFALVMGAFARRTASSEGVLYASLRAVMILSTCVLEVIDSYGQRERRRSMPRGVSPRRTTARKKAISSAL